MGRTSAMPLPRGNQDGGCSLLSTPATAALKLGWSVARLRYYEARYRDELGCLRLPGGDPLFTDRQLQALANLDKWLQQDGTPETVVRERLRALRNWLTKDLPLAPVPVTTPATTGRTDLGPESLLPAPELEPPSPAVLPPAPVWSEESSLQSELALLKDQVQDLVERVRGMEETLSDVLAYLQAGGSLTVKCPFERVSGEEA
ncbi:MAG: hypothetical protein IMX00_05035, partial [Limnochordales bacterium]|nr:hypothetical protein [Limnochordales bacterium]